MKLYLWSMPAFFCRRNYTGPVQPLIYAGNTEPDSPVLFDIKHNITGIVSFSVADTDIVSTHDTEMETIIIYDVE